MNTFDWRETHKDTQWAQSHTHTVCVRAKRHMYDISSHSHSHNHVKQLYRSSQATALHETQTNPSVTGSVTESDMLICKKAVSISAVSNHITALQLKCVWCLFWLLFGIWGSIPASRINSGQESLLCVCVRVCVSRCASLHAKTVPATRLILASEWITFSLLSHPSNTPRASQSERGTGGERDHKKRS